MITGTRPVAMGKRRRRPFFLPRDEAGGDRQEASKAFVLPRVETGGDRQEAAKAFSFWDVASGNKLEASRAFSKLKGCTVPAAFAR